MASHSDGSSRDTPGVAVGSPVDTTLRDTLCEKAITANKIGRTALAAVFYRRAIDEALRLQNNEETFVSTYLSHNEARLIHCRSIGAGGRHTS